MPIAQIPLAPSVCMLTQRQAVAGIDFNTPGLLTGMMVIVAITQKGGVFQYVAVGPKRQSDPWRLLVILSGVTAAFSACLTM